MNQFLWLTPDHENGLGIFINISQIVQADVNGDDALVLALSNGSSFTVRGSGMFSVVRILLEHSLTVKGQRISDTAMKEMSEHIVHLARSTK